MPKKECMNWYQTIRAEQKMAFDWQGVGKGLFLGGLLASPFAAGIIAVSLGLTPNQAQEMIESDPVRAEQIVQTAPPDVVERARNMAAAPMQDYRTEQQQVEPQSGQKISVDQMTDFVAQWEGFEDTSYPDGDSRSVGYGFYLGNQFSRQMIESVGANFDRVFAGQEKISQAQARQLLTGSIEMAINDAYSYYPGLTEHPQQVQMIIVDMAYTLGNKINLFEKTRAALENRDYAEAARQMGSSKWFDDVKRRGVHHVNLMNSLAQ